jgi:type II secretory pathway component PulK
MVEAPEADSLSEPWAEAAQQEVVLETGRFAVTIRDAQAGLDLNGLAGRGLAQSELLRRLAAELELPAAVATRIEEAVRADAPLLRLDQVEGLDAEAMAALAPVVTFLPLPGAVNLNTADLVLMGVVLGNRTAARRLVQLRERKGAINRDDLADLGLVPGPGVGFRSDVWDVEVLAEVDGVAVTLTSRFLRRRAPGSVEVLVIARRFGATPSPLQPLPEGA